MQIKELKFHMDGIDYDLCMKQRMMLVIGDSGTGKTYLYKALSKLRLLRKDLSIVCINLDTGLTPNEIEMRIENAKDTLFVIDNAGILLSDTARITISMDTQNQFIIFTHDTYGFKPVTTNFVELNIINGKGYFEYVLE